MAIKHERDMTTRKLWVVINQQPAPMIIKSVFVSSLVKRIIKIKNRFDCLCHCCECSNLCNVSGVLLEAIKNSVRKQPAIVNS